MMKLFLIKLLLLLPLAFASWYFSLAFFNIVVTETASWLMVWLEPAVVRSMVYESGNAVMLSKLLYQGGEISVDVNPAKYLVGLPLFVSLVLASGKLSTDTVFGILFACTMILFVAAWGVVFDVYHVLLFQLNQLMPSELLQHKVADLYALAYQLNVLIMPVLLPLLLWLWLKASFVKMLAGRDVTSQ